MSDKKGKFVNMAMIAGDHAELSAIMAASEAAKFQTVAYPGEKPEGSQEDSDSLADYQEQVDFAASEFARLNVEAYDPDGGHDPERLAHFYRSTARTAMENGGQVVLVWEETLRDDTRGPGLAEFHRELAINRELVAAGIPVVQGA